MDPLLALSAYLDTLDYPAFIQDAAGRWLAANDAFCKLMLKPRAKLLGTVPGVGEDEELPNWADWKPAFVCGGMIEVNDEFRLPDQTIQRVMTSKRVIALADGRRVLVGEMRRSAAIASSREDEQLFRVIAEAMPYPMLLVNSADQLMIACNQRASEVFGWPSSGIIGQRLEELFVDANDCRQLLLMVRSHGSIKDYETCLRTASEQRIWGLVSARKSSLRGENVLLLGINDITERKRAEEALRDSESRYRAILQTTAEGYVLIDLAENAIVDVNPALCRMLGTRRQELVGARLDQYIALESREEWQKQSDKFAVSQHRQFELKLHTLDGHPLQVLANSSTLFDPLGRATSVFAMLTDITERKLNEDRVLYLAFYDTLTALPNRYLLSERVEQALLQQKRQGGQIALMFIDLDDFKQVNDTLGHDVGDALLQEVAKRLNECVRRSDTVARLGGDEFIVLLPNLKSREDAALVAEKIISSLNEPIYVGKHQLSARLSIGIAIAPLDGMDATSLKKAADMAMYRAKGQGKNGYAFFSAPLRF